MIATGSVAFANARVRVMKSRLLGHEISGRVLAGLAATRDDRIDPARGFAELIDWYTVVLKSYPRGQPLILALLRRHEIENLKLVWRVIVNTATSPWLARWIDLGRLAALSLQWCRECGTLPALVDAVRRTPYAGITRDMWRAHADDPAAAEFGFDRWASAQIVAAVADLPDADHTAIEIALAVVRERAASMARRLKAAGLPTPPLALPRAWQRHAPIAADDDRLLLWLRRARKRLCRRAFLETPFSLAPAVALLLLKEEEIRGLEAIAAFDPSLADAAWLDYAFAASELGA